MFLRKHWIPLSVFLLAIVGIGILYCLQTRPPKDLIKIYRTVEPIDSATPALAVSETAETRQTPQKIGVATGDTPMPDETDSVPNEIEYLEKGSAFLPDDFVSEETPAEAVPVSPHGFGPYPEVPADYPWNPIWTFSAEKRKGYSDNDPEMERGLELMSRVAIKVWKSGRKDFKGKVFSRGRVYLNFPNTVYAEVSELGDKTVVSVIGTGLSEEEIANIGKGINPSGITVLDMSEGIEPISFLGL